MRTARRSWALVLVGLAMALSPGGVRASGDTAAALPADDRAPSVAEARRLRIAGRIAEAEAMLRPLLEEAERRHGQESAQAAEALDELVTTLGQKQGAGDDALALAERAVRLRETLHGPDDVRVADALVRQSDLFILAGDPAAAALIDERALAIRERALAPDDVEIAESLDRLASSRADLGQPAEARPLYERALRVYELAEGPEGRNVSGVLNNLGTVLSELGEFAEAQRVLERAVALRERTHGKDDPATATCLNNLGEPLMRQGDIEGARRVLERALAIREAKLGSADPRTATTLLSLTSVLGATGEWPAAIRLAERALEAREASLGAGHLLVGEALHNLASAWWNAGDPRKALDLQRRVLPIFEKALGPDSPAVAVTLRDESMSLLDLGETAAARKAAETALALLQARLGPGHPEVALAMNNLAQVAWRQRDYVPARELHERLLPLLERSYGARSHNLVPARISAGWSALAAGDTVAALEHLRHALEIAEERLGPAHEWTGTARAGMAKALAASGDREGALASALAAASSSREQLRVMARGLSESQAMRLEGNALSGLPLAISLVIADPGLTGGTRAVLDAVVRSRALVLDESARRQRGERGATDAETKRLASALGEARRKLAGLVVRASPDGAPARREQVAAATAAVERAERDLAARDAAFRGDQEHADAGLDDVLAGLDAETALVSYRVDDITPFGRTSDPSTPTFAGLPLPTRTYVAFVVRGGTSEPRVVDLGPAAEIDALVSHWRGSILDPATAPRSARDAGEDLRRRVWDPVVPLFGDARRVVVVPDGALALVSLAALPAPGPTAGRARRWLVESGPTLHVVSAERDLAPSSWSPATGAGLLAVGEPSFDARPRDVEPMMLASRTTNARTEEARRRGGHATCASFEDMRFLPLPAARREARDVTALWRRTTKDRGTAAELEGIAATEDAVADRARGVRVLHLATHGFFLGGECASPARSSTRGIMSTVETPDRPAHSFVARDSPLLLSGLALAGANRRAEASQGESDGIWTAQEIAGLDLSRCEWAVLSACGSGLGDLKAGEGVVGLERAFKVAGARTVVMSLWSVDDEATRRWMNELYRARLVRGLDTASCVREASLAVLRARRARGEDDSPFWWGAFVASGDWR